MAKTQASEPSEFMKTREVAEKLGVRKQTLLKLIQEGKAPQPTFRAGIGFRFNREAVNAWIAAGGTQEQPK